MKEKKGEHETSQLKSKKKKRKKRDLKGDPQCQQRKVKGTGGYRVDDEVVLVQPLPEERSGMLGGYRTAFRCCCAVDRQVPVDRPGLRVPEKLGLRLGTWLGIMFTRVD